MVSSISSFEVNVVILETFKEKLPHSTVIVTAEDIDDALELYRKGADYVVLPHFLGANYVSKMVKDLKRDYRKLSKEGIVHINELKERKELGHKHPRLHA